MEHPEHVPPQALNIPPPLVVSEEGTPMNYQVKEFVMLRQNHSVAPRGERREEEDFLSYCCTLMALRDKNKSLKVIVILGRVSP